jgi:hypothetical protein
VPVIVTCIEPDKTPSKFILSFIVVLIELVNKFNEPVLVSIESTLFLVSNVVVATEDDKFPIELETEELKPLVVAATEDDKFPIELETEELKPLVVASTEEDKLPILELKPDVVVATELDKLPILELKPDVVVATELDNPLVVVATELDNEPILVDILELNVEYPVVPVIIT